MVHGVALLGAFLILIPVELDELSLGSLARHIVDHSVIVLLIDVVAFRGIIIDFLDLSRFLANHDEVFKLHVLQTHL